MNDIECRYFWDELGPVLTDVLLHKMKIGEIDVEKLLPYPHKLESNEQLLGFLNKAPQHPNNFQGIYEFKK